MPSQREQCIESLSREWGVGGIGQQQAAAVPLCESVAMIYNACRFPWPSCNLQALPAPSRLQGCVVGYGKLVNENGNAVYDTV